MYYDEVDTEEGGAGAEDGAEFARCGTALLKVAD